MQSNVHPVSKYFITDGISVYMDYGGRFENLPLFMRVYDYVVNPVFLENKKREAIDLRTVKLLHSDQFQTLMKIYVPNQGYIVVAVNSDDLSFLKNILQDGMFVFTLYDFLMVKREQETG